jgi:hypothetical protein
MSPCGHQLQMITSIFMLNPLSFAVSYLILPGSTTLVCFYSSQARRLAWKIYLYRPVQLHVVYCSLEETDSPGVSVRIDTYLDRWILKGDHHWAVLASFNVALQGRHWN